MSGVDKEATDNNHVDEILRCATMPIWLTLSFCETHGMVTERELDVQNPRGKKLTGICKVCTTCDPATVLNAAIKKTAKPCYKALRYHVWREHKDKLAEHPEAVAELDRRSVRRVEDDSWSPAPKSDATLKGKNDEEKKMTALLRVVLQERLTPQWATTPDAIRMFQAMGWRSAKSSLLKHDSITAMLRGTHDAACNSIREELMMVDWCSISIDTWSTGPSARAFPVYIHFLDMNMDLQTRAIGVLPSPTRYGVSASCMALRVALSSIGIVGDAESHISHRVVALTAEASDTFRHIAELLHVPLVPCHIHQIQSIVTQAFSDPGVSEMLRIVRMTIQYFKQCNTAHQLLRHVFARYVQSSVHAHIGMMGMPADELEDDSNRPEARPVPFVNWFEPEMQEPEIREPIPDVVAWLDSIAWQQRGFIQELGLSPDTKMFFAHAGASADAMAHSGETKLSLDYASDWHSSLSMLRQFQTSFIPMVVSLHALSCCTSDRIRLGGGAGSGGGQLAMIEISVSPKMRRVAGEILRAVQTLDIAAVTETVKVLNVVATSSANIASENLCHSHPLPDLARCVADVHSTVPQLLRTQYEINNTVARTVHTALLEGQASHRQSVINNLFPGVPELMSAQYALSRVGFWDFHPYENTPQQAASANPADGPTHGHASEPVSVAQREVLIEHRRHDLLQQARNHQASLPSNSGLGMPRPSQASVSGTGLLTSSAAVMQLCNASAKSTGPSSGMAKRQCVDMDSQQDGSNADVSADSNPQSLMSAAIAASQVGALDHSHVTMPGVPQHDAQMGAPGPNAPQHLVEESLSDEAQVEKHMAFPREALDDAWVRAQCYESYAAYWHRSQFPVLRPLARKYGCILGSCMKESSGYTEPAITCGTRGARIPEGLLEAYVVCQSSSRKQPTQGQEAGRAAGFPTRPAANAFIGAGYAAASASGKRKIAHI